MRIAKNFVAILVCSTVLMLAGDVAAQTAVPEEPTFAHDVAPILYKSCIN